eukprot:scaffold251398_cov31-Tisochrysis_lutea.AAC.4
MAQTALRRWAAEVEDCVASRRLPGAAVRVVAWRRFGASPPRARRVLLKPVSVRALPRLVSPIELRGGATRVVRKGAQSDAPRRYGCEHRAAREARIATAQGRCADPIRKRYPSGSLAWSARRCSNAARIIGANEFRRNPRISAVSPPVVSVLVLVIEDTAGEKGATAPDAATSPSASPKGRGSCKGRRVAARWMRRIEMRAPPAACKGRNDEVWGPGAHGRALGSHTRVSGLAHAPAWGGERTA